MKQQSLEESKALAQGYAAVPVVREILADTATPIGLVSLVRKESSRYFLLESLEQNDQAAGIPSSASTLLPGSGPRTGTPGGICRQPDPGRSQPAPGGPPVHPEGLPVPKIPGLPPFTGRFVGYFSYDFSSTVTQLHFDPAKPRPSRIST